MFFYVTLTIYFRLLKIFSGHFKNYIDVFSQSLGYVHYLELSLSLILYYLTPSILRNEFHKHICKH